MNRITRIARWGIVVGLAAFASACVVAPGPEPSEGYRDRDHNRYYHEHRWHRCSRGDDFCR